MQEVLQGIREAEPHRVARNAMLALPTLEAPMPLEVSLEASQLYRTARNAGITVRSATDCLIAACALRHDAVLLHRDRDYDHLARVSSLRVAQP